MKINLIFGFLGSGKTTLIRQFLKDQTDLSKTAVIVNEFGDVGIDGLILEGDHVDIVELASGCLCCNLKGPMLDAIDEIQASGNIETLLIESSGVAEPVDTLDALTDPKLRSKFEIGPIVTVVNAPHFEKLTEILGDFFTDQIRNADVLILNKVDLINSTEIEEIRSLVQDMNQRADLIYADHCDVDLNELLRIEYRTNKTFPIEQSEPDRPSRQQHNHQHDQMDSLVVKNTNDVTQQQLESWFQSLPNKLYRAKGFVMVDGVHRLVQYSMGQLNIEKNDRPTPFQMVFIGKDIDRPLIRTQYESLGSTL